MEISMDQSGEPPNYTSHPNKKNSNSNNSCSDIPDNLNRTETESKQIILITLVSQEPAIFNCKHEDYRNNSKKDELWLAMSKQVGWSDSYCKNKWKAIRDQYCRELKRTRTNCNVKIKWKYFRHLEFLRPYALSRNYRGKLVKEVNHENEIADQEESSNTQEESSNTQEESSNTQEESTITTFSTNNEESSSFKTESWGTCENSDFLNDNNDITTHIIMQLSQQSHNNLYTEDKNEEEHQAPQDDEDDDPIHTFLNIESYFEKELITLVQKTTILYDVSHSSYRNTKVKLKVWEEIARKLKRTVRQCRLKWKALRDQYIREHKRLKNLGGCKTLARWKHYDAMSFLEQFIKERCEYNTFVPIEDTNNEISIHDFEQEEMIILPNKNENNDTNQYNILGDDDTSGIYAERLYSPIKCPEDDETTECIPGEKPNHLMIEEVTQVTEAQSSSNDETDDEVGAFFRAVAMKIRKADMSAVAFTELQIDILKAITNALRD